MAEGKATPNESFDIDKLHQLVEMMEKYDLREVRLRGGGQSWMLRRGAQQEVVQALPAYAAPYPQAAPAAPQQPSAAPAAPAPPAAPAGDADLKPIKSPMVGTFYLSPQPGEPAFVKPGDKVKADTVVCLVEAMKFFNQIKSEVSGTIARILVKDGDAVEFGQTLFLVKAD